MKYKRIVLVSLIAIVLAGILSACKTSGNTSSAQQENTSTQQPANGASNSSVGLAVGNIAPDFTLGSLDGTNITLSKLRGKNVILNFWATDCPFCVEEMPAINDLYKNHKDGLVVLAVNLGEDKNGVIQAYKLGAMDPITVNSYYEMLNDR